MSRGGGTFGWAAALALAALLTPIAATAQTVDRDCRCVDADGNPIERCTCLREPDLRGMLSLAMGAERPRLGVSVTASEGSDAPAGALVTDVMEDGPADEAGIREGDVITAVDGRSLSEPMGAEAERDFDLDDSVPVQRLLAIVESLEPGQRVEVDYVREGRTQTTVVEARELPRRFRGRIALPGMRGDALVWDRLRESPEGAIFRFRGDPDGREERWRVTPPGDVHVLPEMDGVRAFGIGGGPLMLGAAGLELVEVGPALGEYFGVTEGVLVTNVRRSSGLGLEPGDVVVRIGDRSVTTPDRFRRILASFGEDEDIVFQVVRDGERTTVTGRMRY